MGQNYRVVVRTPVLVENLSDEYETPVDYVYKPPPSDVIKEGEALSISLSRDEIDYAMSGHLAKSVIDKLAINRDVPFEVMYGSMMKNAVVVAHIEKQIEKQGEEWLANASVWDKWKLYQEQSDVSIGIDEEHILGITQQLKRLNNAPDFRITSIKNIDDWVDGWVSEYEEIEDIFEWHNAIFNLTSLTKSDAIKEVQEYLNQYRKQKDNATELDGNIKIIMGVIDRIFKSNPSSKPVPVNLTEEQTIEIFLEIYDEKEEARLKFKSDDDNFPMI
ncbi:MAG: hypothetical protein HOM97_08475 [Nitrospina sp.]|jgi:hypothetical protein|nr:hypothetical protein [Nitrospina sp.]